VEASHLVLPAILLLTALALLMSGIAIMFQIRRDRLPDATRFENIRELRAQEEQLLAARRAELSIVEQKIQQRDRLIAEVAGLEERRTVVQAELASLDSARHEIEEVKSEAAEAAAELAKISQELASKRDEFERLNAECDPAHIAALQQELKRLAQEQSDINTMLPALRAERDSALQRIEEASGIQARIAAREVDRNRLDKEISELQAKIEQLQGEMSKLKEIEAKVLSLRDEASRLQSEFAGRDVLVSEIRNLESERTRLDAEVATIGGQIAALEGRKLELAQIRAQRDELEDEVARLVARKERLQLETSGDPIQDPEQLLGDLKKMPPSLEAPGIIRGVPRTEQEALHAVSDYLRAYSLDYSARTVRAFHTALKINDNSQLTVLAGVSGTGKSLLPRRYAEAMGIHFLQIAVEPRWDSPQDLLGFYNYIEKNYRATDLARMLFHMNPYGPACADQVADRKDHIALVLLDEMNLARVEYYFSEFLSRLEARPRFSDVGEQRKRADALIPIDIRGLKSPISLFPAHNVLFVGTMNDDESTQALSDKVLDRGNILQFAAPREFPNLTNVNGVERPNEAQSFKSWRTWVRPTSSLNGSSRNMVDSLVSKLAEIMEDCGRPFGHRLRDAIIAYVANYPSVSNGAVDFRVPLADQIDLRILSKLRGLEIDSHRAAFESLDRLLREDVNDAVMADRLAELRERQSKGTGLFVWRGLTREG
jgi:hypothetical protein